MDKMITELNIMIEGLKKKANALGEILNITENQKTVIESELPYEEVRTIIFKMNEGKQSAIEIVRNCDDMFEAMLKDIGADLEARQDMYKPQVSTMQTWIRKVVDFDIKIRVGEDENNRLLDAKRALAQGGTLPTTESSSEPPPATPGEGMKPKAKPLPLNPVRVAKAYEEGSKNYKG